MSKVAAIWLLANILLPFTAPFKTYDLTQTRRDQVCDQFVKDKPGSSDKVLVAWNASSGPSILNAVSAVSPHLSNQVDGHRSLATVLRI